MTKRIIHIEGMEFKLDSCMDCPCCSSESDYDGCDMTTDYFCRCPGCSVVHIETPESEDGDFPDGFFPEGCILKEENE